MFLFLSWFRLFLKKKKKLRLRKRIITIVNGMGNPRVMKRRKRSCKSKSSFFFFPNLRYGRFNFFFDSAGFAGAFVDRIVETKGVSQVFFSLSLSLDN